jgi:hypothetical protein
MVNQIVFLFGAGASKGATHILPYCPPLMRELYDELAKYDPDEWGPASQLSAYADKFRRDFEATFSEVVLKIPRDDTAPRTTSDSLTLLEKQRVLARYFSQFSLDPSSMNYYSKLLAALDAAGWIPDCLFASLNYDCLFEQAGHQLGLPVDYLCSESKSIRVAKLHGSCNFITKSLPGYGQAMLTSSGQRYESALDFLSPMDIEKILKEKFSNPACHPVMSQVSPGKEQIVAPVKIQKMRNSWSQALPSAKHFVIIGISYNRNDTHVVKPIRDTRAKILCIGDKDNFKKWHAENENFEHIEETFEKGFEPLIRRLGVK